jgi:hypothetical protein
MKETLQKEGAAGHPETPGKSMVTIFINGIPKSIHRGRQSVLDIKTLGGVPGTYVLSVMFDGVLTPLEDAGSITIKGDEQFFGHIKDGGSA